MATDTLVMYAAPGMGHMISMVELAKLILKHYSHKFSLTVLYMTGALVDTPAVPAYISRITQSHPSISFHCFQRTRMTIRHNETRSLPALMFEFIRQNDPSVSLALQEISETVDIRAFIIYMFCSSSMFIAKELNIPTFYFYTSGGAALAAFLYFPTIHEKVKKSFKDMRDDEFEFLVFEAPLHAVHMPEPMLVRNDPAYSDFVNFCYNMALSDGIIANTLKQGRE